MYTSSAKVKEYGMGAAYKLPPRIIEEKVMAQVMVVACDYWKRRPDWQGEKDYPLCHGRGLSGCNSAHWGRKQKIESSGGCSGWKGASADEKI